MTGVRMAFGRRSERLLWELDPPPALVVPNPNIDCIAFNVERLFGMTPTFAFARPE
jgi:hypothetical protein